MDLTSTLKGSRDFEQCEYLAYLSVLTTENAQFAAVLGSDYLVAPEVFFRDLYKDEEINVK